MSRANLTVEMSALPSPDKEWMWETLCMTNGGSRLTLRLPPRDHVAFLSLLAICTVLLLVIRLQLSKHT